MDATRRRFLIILIVGGVAVLGSYAHGLATHPETRNDVWGGVPEALKPLYTVSMFSAAAGWLLFTSYLFFRLPPLQTRSAGGLGYGAFVALQTVALVGSALWMPLTVRYLDAPSAGLWWLIRLDLLAVGLASLGIIAALATAKPRPAPLWRALALLGSLLFAFQTFVLDALVWPAYFPV
jgi:hypothetical protein